MVFIVSPPQICPLLSALKPDLKYFFRLKNQSHCIPLTDYWLFRLLWHFKQRSSLLIFFRDVVVHNSTSFFKLFTISSNFWSTLLTLILVSTETTSYQDMLNPPLHTEVKKSSGSLSLTNSLIDRLKPQLWFILSPIPFCRWFRSLEKWKYS